MNILVCFKVAEKLDAVNDREWSRCLDYTDHPAFLEYELGMYDEAALETGLQLRDCALSFNIPVSLTAFSIGNEVPDVLVRHLFGVKFDRVIIEKAEQDLRFRPGYAADLICGLVKETAPYDVIVMGQQAAPGDNGRTHICVSESMGIPCILHVKEVSLEEDGMLVVSDADEGTLTRKVRGPIVLAVGDAGHSYLRSATLRERMAAAKKSAEERTAAANLGSTEYETFSGLYRERAGRDCRWIEGNTVREKIDSLYRNFCREMIKEEKAEYDQNGDDRSRLYEE